MRAIFALTLATAVILEPGVCRAAPTGNELLNLCGGYDNAHADYSQGVCIGTINGVISGMLFMDHMSEASVEKYLRFPDGRHVKPVYYFCPGDMVTQDQTVRIVLQYLRAHPEATAKSSPSLILAAMAEAFPCPAVEQAPPHQKQ
jgi:hypothetical protein